MNGFAFCDTDAKRLARHHRIRFPDFTRCLMALNVRSNGGNAPKSPSLLTSTNECKSDQRTTSKAINDTKSNHWSQVGTNQWFHTVIIVTLCCLCYSNAFFGQFVFDDISAIKENRDLRPETPVKQLLSNDFWGQPMIKSYRPVCVFTFRINYLLHRLHPFGYHLVNVMLHIIDCLLYVSIHPIHTEAVTSIVGRAETLCSLFYLLALLSYSSATKRRTLTRELRTMLDTNGFIYLLLLKQIGNYYFYRLHSHFWLHSARNKESPPLQYAAFTKLSSIKKFDNPAAYAEWPIRQMTHNYLFAVNAWLLLNPMNLCCDWTMGTVPLLNSIADIRNIATIFFYFSLCMMAWQALIHRNRSDSIVIIIGVTLLIVPFLPASNLFFYVGFVVAERVLYIPSFGFCLLIAFGTCKLYDHFSFNRIARMVISLALIMLIIGHCCRTVLRNNDWSNELKLFSSGMRINPHNAKLFNNVGHVWESERRYEEALRFFLQATHIQPDDIGAYLNVGRAYNNLKKFELAEQFFRKAKDLLLTPEVTHHHPSTSSYYARIAPSHMSVFLNLATLISQNRSRLKEAELLYSQAIRMKPDYVDAYINRAELLLKMNQTDAAEKLGVVAIESGRLQEAVAYFETAIHYDPEHQQALLNYAIVVQDLSRIDLYDLAQNRLKKLLTIAPPSERVYFHLGMFAMNSKQYEQAEKYFRNAIQIRTDFRSATFNLALLLSNANRHLEAVPYLEQLIHYHPDHTKGLTLLCDIMINQIKNMDQAEICYKRILRLQPRNIQAKHNLCVVYVEQGHLDRAEQCLSEAAAIVPSQDYIDRHLKIVRLRILRMRQTAKR
ncbi:hypothetical protein RDWZM_005859 [Blomia tropicalis]|uniref:dolichyl-phosphate-mannose--protein mannosyltransferase n=1 Tax=Blomia tropicalis TaxID=40697 RepID=A0A9Q0M8I7_BLOTA|nr:hypothetical protein RDWZM_005859 [Blomia tropicalis]